MALDNLGVELASKRTANGTQRVRIRYTPKGLFVDRMYICAQWRAWEHVKEGGSVEEITAFYNEMV